RLREQPVFAAAAPGAQSDDHRRGEERNRREDDQRVEEPRELADEERTGVASRALEPPLTVRHRDGSLWRRERERDGRKRALAHRARARLRLLRKCPPRLVELVLEAEA